ncbi:MAG: hypothetical protein WC714_04280 [Candidatus Obscuribacterales bacterium]|jgi:hypothetical protein
MTKNWLLALSTFIISAAACAAVSAAPPVKTTKKPPPPDYFPARYKYSWKYQTTTADGKKTNFSMKDIHDDKQSDGAIWHQFQIETSPTQKFSDWYSKGNGLVLDNHIEYEGSGMKADFVPPKQTLKHPLENGDNWQWSGTGMMKVAATETYSVTGPEEVIVPAGKFNAMKVTSEVTSIGSKATKTYWYGPNVGLVKSITESGPVKSTTELVSYDFPKLLPGELEAEINRPR